MPTQELRRGNATGSHDEKGNMFPHGCIVGYARESSTPCADASSMEVEGGKKNTWNRATELCFTCGNQKIWTLKCTSHHHHRRH